MKILQIVDVPYWAIGKLSQSIVDNNPALKFKVIYVHPKHVAEHLDEVRAWVDWADIVDFQYWNTARQLLDLIPELRAKPNLLSHHNEKDLLSADWSDINLHIAETKHSEEVLSENFGKEKVKLIPLAIDLDEFTYNPTLPNTKTVGYAGRVVPWKGLKEVARACYELGYTLKFMGKFDKPDYWASIPIEHQAIIDMEFMDCEDVDRKDFYHSLDIYVGNSNAGRETGTLPFMEALASGVPVITTPAGLAADIIEDHENGILTEFEDYEALKNNLQMLMGNEELKNKIRTNGWNTIKNFSVQQRAWEFEKVYHQVYSQLPLVSVIIPAFNANENLVKSLENLEASREFYSHIEVVIANDGGEDLSEEVIKEWRNTFTFPIKYIDTGNNGYGLAQARNMAVIEAQGRFLMFADSRMQPDVKAVTMFMQKIIDEYKDKKVWLFGDKGANKTAFVENFSFINRDLFIRAGMFNERVNRYGGMSQELRARFKWQGFEPVYVPEAKAIQLSGSHMTLKRRADIVASKIMLWKLHLNG